MKTPIRRLDSLTHNDTAATKLINDNFEALQQGIEDSLSRTGKTPNFMDAPLDMNMNRIINIADPVDDYDLANKHYVDEAVAGFQEQLDAETEARQNADSTLQGNIDAEETRAKAAEKAINDTLETFGDIVTHNADEFATAAQGAKADTAVQPGDLANVATSGDYNDLNNKPTIPTVNNATITFKQGGTTKGTISLNQSKNEEIDLDAGGGTVTNAITLTGITVSIEAGTTQSSIDVSSSIESGTKYMPIVVFQEVSAVDVLKYCVFNSSTGKVVIYTNGKVVGDSNVAITLIPVESTSTTIKGLTNGIGEFEEYTAVEVETLWSSI